VSDPTVGTVLAEEPAVAADLPERDPDGLRPRDDERSDCAAITSTFGDGAGRRSPVRTTWGGAAAFPCLRRRACFTAHPPLTVARGSNTASRRKAEDERGRLSAPASGSLRVPELR